MKQLLFISGLLFLTSCATKRDWKESHYKNANAAQEAKTLCDSGQNKAAAKLGYTCYPRDKHGNILNRAVASSNGNISNIYINSSGTPQNQNMGSQMQLYKAMETLYNQERNDRLNRIKTFNGN
tara:strand:- start:56 stop:427 length:372 start_codon:yes stop_codon:yes gene_type:complete